MNAELTSRILKKLEQVHAQAPDLRFGQLVAIIGELAADETGFGLWDVEDPDFVGAVDRFAADLARRESGDATPAAVPERSGISPSPVSTQSQPPRTARR